MSVYSEYSLAGTAERLAIKVLFLPHFELGDLIGDFPGEAQGIYKSFFVGGDTMTLANGEILHLSADHAMALLTAGEGKSNSAMNVTVLLTDPRLDLSQTRLIAIGCAGGAYGYTTIGDTCIVTSTVDIDLGHTADPRELEDKDIKWFYDDEFRGLGSFHLNEALTEKAYELTKGLPMRTTETVEKAMRESFGDVPWAVRKPRVIKGTACSGDNYWKGMHDHEKAAYMVRFFGCKDPFAVSEMEDNTIAYVLSRFGLLQNLLIVRTVVNMDVFLKGDSPEALWKEKKTNTIAESTSETLDAFLPAMENMTDVVKVLAEAVLKGTL